MAEKIDELKQQRAGTKKNLSRIKKIIEQSASGEGKKLTALELKCRLGIVESYYKQAMGLQTAIEKLLPDDIGREDLEEIYISTKCMIQSLLGDDANTTLCESSIVSYVPNKLPPLKLPIFDGKYSDYKNFITSFTQIIDREYNLTNIEKFNHLLGCLRGPALETVKAIQITHENYPKALERLKARYDNNTLIFMENISALFDLQSVSKPNSTQLRSLSDNVSAIYSSLSSLGDDKNISQALLIHLVISKIDEASQRRWKELLDFTKLPTWDDCTKFLERRCQYIESIDTGASAKGENRGSDTKKPKDKASTKKSYTLACSKLSCYVCGAIDHKIYKCPQFDSLSAAEKLERANKLGLCTGCLSKNHATDKCTSKGKCRYCSELHHSKLHESFASDASTSQVAVHTHLSGSNDETVILATALVLVKDATGRFQLGRALLDSCSQINVMTDEFAQKLFLPRKRNQVQITSVGNSQAKTKHMASSVIKSRYSNIELPLNFCIISQIAYQPDNHIDISSWNIPANVNLADEHFNKPNRIDLLIGTESFFEILSIGQINLGANLPILQKTLFGWVIAGKMKHKRPDVAAAFALNVEESINENLEKLWILDDVMAKGQKFTEEQQACEDFYVANVRQSTSGRVVVRLPFKEDPCYLGNSKDNALRRFTALERRFQRQPELKSQYVEFMTEYERLGHMSLVEWPSQTAPHYYIPHHCVFKANSTTTKIRVVFDASCTTTTNKSLNDILMVGATIQEELYMLLLKFRTFRYALTADVVKMYRQVMVSPEDRCFQYILWRDDDKKALQTYQLNTVTYGTAAAPYLAIRSLHFLADLHAESFPVGSTVIKNSFYVDDLICGADSLEDLQRIKHEVTEILSRGCMEITKWHSNHVRMIEDASVVNLNIDECLQTSALGILWHQNTDMFSFEFKPKQKTADTVCKRTILSVASSLFDPLGLISPIIIRAKVLLQEIWLLKLNWDESVPQSICSTWLNLLQDISTISSLRIPRFCPGMQASSFQIHGFCDSSIRAYGCCIYFRMKDDTGKVSVQLLTSKSRVAPTKKRTLPQLELCGAHLLAQLLAKVRGIWHGKDVSIVLWSDSQIVLHWLNQHSATLSTFIGNRVSSIQELTADCSWRHVPSGQNPADIISRGCTVDELCRSNWLHGPSFLSKDDDKWPKSVLNDIDIDEVNKEKRKSAFVIEVQQNYVLSALAKYSSHIKCLRIVAWMHRFYRLTRTMTVHIADTPSLTPQELEHALWCVVWNIQQQYFSDEIRRLKKKQPLNGPLKYLNPFLQQINGFELLKVGGRLENADIHLGQKHPVILPSKYDFTLSYIRHLHYKNCHAGPKALMALIRQRFWIINARSLTRQVVRACIHCVRYRPKLLQQMMGNLPVERLTPSRPFSRCAIDFCGPVNTYLRIRGKAPYKTYICIFVCMATKAVHIEIVSDLSTDAFIAALKRFIGRRGLPTDVFCDNATNFVGAKNKLHDLKQFMFNKANQSKLVTYCANEFINFHFIPPRAPHFGGLWEAAVKSAKGHLNRMLLNNRLTFEELATVMIEVEAIMNSRPLSPLSSDPSDYEAITPAHFLVGSSLKALPQQELDVRDVSNLDRWRAVTAMQQAFWKKWSHDYLNELQMRSKWISERNNVVENSLVLIHDDNAPPQRWHFGRIMKITYGRDGLARVADVKTQNGVIRRPIHKLALLPC